MATTISYFSRRNTAQTPGKRKSTDQSNVAQSYQVTPLFFQETMEANQQSYRLGTVELGDESADLSFDQVSAGAATDRMIDTSGNDGTPNSARESVMSGASSTTFRDTPVGQEDASSIMHT